MDISDALVDSPTCGNHPGFTISGVYRAVLLDVCGTLVQDVDAWVPRSPHYARELPTPVVT